MRGDVHKLSLARKKKKRKKLYLCVYEEPVGEPSMPASAQLLMCT